MKKIARGVTAYELGNSPVTATGHRFTAAELSTTLKDRLPSILFDEAGKAQVRDVLSGLATTDFKADQIEAALAVPPPLRNWQVGEAIAEAYLVDHRDCDFPWPSGRDLRNPNASPTGADLVGFHRDPKGTRFAFGEVKTSEEDRRPPQVVTGRHGLAKQLEELRDSAPVKNHLVYQYLGIRAAASDWKDTYRLAASRYLENPADVSLFGVLVRDIDPDQEDLSQRIATLAKKCPDQTTIELRAFYLPSKTIATLAATALQSGNATS
jgi:hypothetical protein